MRLYLAGPITGIANYQQTFRAAQVSLEAAGHQVLNPADIGERDGWTWADYMRACLPLVCAADGVATLPGWHRSRGALLEVEVAQRLGMVVQTVPLWISQPNGLEHCPRLRLVDWTHMCRCTLPPGHDGPCSDCPRCTAVTA